MSGKQVNDFWYRIVKGLKKFREDQVLGVHRRLEGEAGNRLRRNKCPRVDFSPEGRPRGWKTGLLIQVKKAGGIEKCIKTGPELENRISPGQWCQTFVGIMIGLCSLLFPLCLSHIPPSRSQTEDRSTFARIPTVCSPSQLGSFPDWSSPVPPVDSPYAKPSPTLPSLFHINFRICHIAACRADVKAGSVTGSCVPSVHG